jgi:hypothetical protein
VQRARDARHTIALFDDRSLPVAIDRRDLVGRLLYGAVEGLRQLHR